MVKVDPKGNTMAVIDVRGTNGSGKTWIMRQLLLQHKHTTIEEGGKVIGYSLPSIKGVIIGRYTDTGGGCDGFKEGVVQVDEIVRRLHPQYKNLLLEGIMVSHLYERFHNLATDLGNYKFMFLDTPIKLCIERVKARRLAKGNIKPFDPIKNLIPDYKRTKYRVRQRMTDAGHHVRLINHLDPLPQITKELD